MVVCSILSCIWEKCTRMHVNNDDVETYPPHIGIGAPEDSLQSCYGLIPKPAHKDVIKYNLNASKRLRYLCELDWVHPEDNGRRFIFSYSLADGTITINEMARRNSGIKEGLFLKSMRLQLPDSDPSFPTYYTPDKFYIGGIVPVFKHRFRILGCDLFVYRYMTANPEKFPQEVIDNVRNYHMREGNLKDELKSACIEEEAAEKTAQLGKIGAAAVAQPSAMQKCLTALDVVEGHAAPPRPPTPPMTTDIISYDDTLRALRASKPTCDNLVPLKGILKSGAARDDHQKVVCFTGPSTEQHEQREKKRISYPPGEQPHFTDDPDFCDRFKPDDLEEREARRAADVCAYDVIPSGAPPGSSDDDGGARTNLPGYLGTYGVDCKETADFMRLPPDAYEKAKAMRQEVPFVSPAAVRNMQYARLPDPSVDSCVNPPPEATGPCAPRKEEDVSFGCPRVEPIEPGCEGLRQYKKKKQRQ